MPAGKLGELTGLTTGAITGMIDRLEKVGYVRRTKDPKDRRKTIVEPVRNKKLERVKRRNVRAFATFHYPCFAEADVYGSYDYYLTYVRLYQ
jgi:DNA-binding MarR family transcriptional regulator